LSFVHLHVHTQYSLLEASCRSKKLAEAAKAFGQPAVAITDNGNMFGAVEFYFACKDAGVKPIIGLDIYLSPKSHLVKGEDKEAASAPNRRLVLLAMNQEGYANLCKISSIGYQHGFYYKPRVDYDVLKAHSAGLICLSGDLRGEIPFTFTRFGAEAAKVKIQELKNIFGDRFYLELNRTGVADWDDINRFLIEMSKELGVRLVATNSVHYVEQREQLAQETLICIGSNKTLQDESRFKLGSDQFYFKSSQEMEELFQDLPEAIAATLEIAGRCNVEFKTKDADGKAIYHLPAFKTPTGASPEDYINEMALKGLEVRFQEAAKRGETVAEAQKPVYFERLKFELSVIEKMGFTSYFLIVQDFINWAKENAIPVGPGRGSGAGSLVAFSLRITDLDPVPYNLLFERFLNPERISMPDFDIDFCQDRRGEVIQYVNQKYGLENVSQIITYGKLQARAAIRDVGRTLGMSFAEVDVISKLMPEKLGITLAEAIELEPRIREQMENSPQIATLMDLAQKIEGLVRHAGIHAAGVIIANRPLVTYAPLYRGADNENVVQYDMKWAEKIGLIKFDFLGLKTLTHIKNALDLVQANRGKRIAPQDIPISDPEIYSLMSSGDTAGVFQFEGDGITDAVRKIKPKTFEDITAINALYRPGPMDMIPEYTNRMHGVTKVEYILPELEPILKDTYGVIVYQEHVMAIASKIANYSLGEADMLRRAMGKKIASEMAQQKERFLKGAKQNKFDPDKASEIFDLMAEFANYGFNKSHAAAYCVISAQTAWIKKYYPVEFYAALLSTEMGDTDNVVKYVKSARARGLTVQPPHINTSNWKFSVAGDIMFFGLGAIKGVGEGVVQAIIDARDSLPAKKFSSLDEFFNTIDSKKLNKKVLESLIKANAFEGFEAHQAQLMAQYDRYVERAEGLRHDREMGQASLFSLLDTSGDTKSETLVTLDPKPVWTRTMRLASEKEVLGFYLSDHPLQGLEKIYRAWTTCTVKELSAQEGDKRVILAGLISSYREIISRKGTRMAFCQVEDLTGSFELIVFPDVFAKHEFDLKSEQPLLVGGQLKREGDSIKVLADRVAPFESVLKKTKKFVMKLDHTMQKDIPKLHQLLSQFQGATKYDFEIEVPDLRKHVVLEVEEPHGVELSKELFEGLHEIFGRTDFLEIRGL
jgi:DNA polymerase III subunit alpha